MKHFRVLTRIVVVIIAAFVIGGCSSNRSVVTSTVSKRVKAKNVHEVALLAETYSEWSDFYAPFSLKVSRPMSLSVSGRATMVRDKCIYLSFRMFGFEVAVIYIDAEKIVAADKFHKIMVSDPITALTARTGLTVGDIQDVLLGRAFYPGRGTLCSIDMPESLFSPSTDGDMTILRPRRIPEGASWYYAIDDIPTLRRLTIEPDGFSPFTVNFSDILDCTAGAVASEVSLAGKLDGRSVEAMYEWNLKKARWNESPKIPTLNLSGYKQMSASELMNALKQM